jgi:hypothetical protein
VASWLNRWPYHCAACNSRFWSDCRWPTNSRPAGKPKPARPTVAQIEVRATSAAQLDEMLLSLNQALSKFQSASPVHNPLADALAPTTRNAD